MPGFNPRTFKPQNHSPIQRHVNLGSAGAGPILRRNASRLSAVSRQPKLVIKQPAVGAAAKKPPPFRPPKDEVVRGIASRIAEQEYRSRRRTRWGKIVRAYCREMMGYTDRGLEVEEFVYIRLKQEADSWREINRVMKNHEMVAMLEMVAAKLFGKIEDHLINLAKRGRRVKARSPHENYETVMATLGLKSARKVFIVFKPFADRDPEIVSVKSAREFRRGVRNRFTRQERTRRQKEAARQSFDYRNVPQVMRH